jgi:cysteinyl-tRNA synthetase
VSESLLQAVRALATELKTPVGNSESDALDPLVEAFIAQRNAARKSKNYALADQIRKRLGELGVTLEDRPGGTGWRLG